MDKHVEAGGFDHRSVDIIKVAYDCLAFASARTTNSALSRVASCSTVIRLVPLIVLGWSPV
jgi:hypothetical protein